MTSTRVKKVIIVVGTIILCLLGLLGYAYYEIINNPIDIGIDEIGKSLNIVIRDDEVNDFTRLDGDDFSILKDDEIEKLRLHMKQNDLEIESGEYLVNQIYDCDDFIEVFKLIE